MLMKWNLCKIHQLIRNCRVLPSLNLHKPSFVSPSANSQQGPILDTYIFLLWSFHPLLWSVCWGQAVLNCDINHFVTVRNTDSDRKTRNSLESGQIPGNNVVPQHPAPSQSSPGSSAFWCSGKWSDLVPDTLTFCFCRVGRRSWQLWFVVFLFHGFLTAATFESLPGSLQWSRTDKIWSLMSLLSIFIFCVTDVHTQEELQFSLLPNTHQRLLQAQKLPGSLVFFL